MNTAQDMANQMLSRQQQAIREAICFHRDADIEVDVDVHRFAVSYCTYCGHILTSDEELERGIVIDDNAIKDAWLNR